MKTTKVKQLQPSVEEVHSRESLRGEELFQKESIKDSPFTVVTKDGESFGVMGQYRLTEPMKSVKAVKEELSKITWNRIVQVIMVLDESKSKLNTKKQDKV